MKKKKFFIILLLLIIGNHLILIQEKLLYSNHKIEKLLIINDNSFTKLSIQKLSIWFVTMTILAFMNVIVKMRYRFTGAVYINLFYTICFFTSAFIVPHPIWFKFCIIPVVIVPYIFVPYLIYVLKYSMQLINIGSSTINDNSMSY